MDEPCNESHAIKKKGRWIKAENDNINVNPAVRSEAFKRLDAFHQQFEKLYPEPIGVDIQWSRSIAVSDFGEKRAYRLNRDGVSTYDVSNVPHFNSYTYLIAFPSHFCLWDGKNKNGTLMPGEKHGDAVSFSIRANSLSEFYGETGDDWTIDGLPVRTLRPVNEQWKGYDVYNPKEGKTQRFLLIHRPGILPYKSVSKKLYLERSIVFNSKIFDTQQEAVRNMPVRSLEEQDKEKKQKLVKFEKDFGSDAKRLKSAVDYYLSGYQTDQQRRDEQLAKITKGREQQLKPFYDELEKARQDGSLDSPAMVLQPYLPNPVFESDPLKANMMVTENPDYVRKDLPKHVPQFFVFSWNWSDYPPHREMEKKFFQNFPIEKVQPMLDK